MFSFPTWQTRSWHCSGARQQSHLECLKKAGYTTGGASTGGNCCAIGRAWRSRASMRPIRRGSALSRGPCSRKTKSVSFGTLRPRPPPQSQPRFLYRRRQSRIGRLTPWIGPGNRGFGGQGLAPLAGDDRPSGPRTSAWPSLCPRLALRGTQRAADWPSMVVAGARWPRPRSSTPQNIGGASSGSSRCLRRRRSAT